MRAMSSSALKVTHDAKLQKFYLELPGRTADNTAFVEYEELRKVENSSLCCGVGVTFFAKGVWNFYHTETPKELQGKGYAGVVVDAALDYCKKNAIEPKVEMCTKFGVGLSFYSQATCSYVQKVLDKSKY